jgi:hypothetical protein
VPDIVYACDRQWWQEYEAQWTALKAARWTSNAEAAALYGLQHIPRMAQHPELVDGHVSGGGNSGHEAVSLAYHMGASAIILLGFDMLSGDNGEQHWHGRSRGKADQSRRVAVPESGREIWHRLAASIEARGVPVRNATRRTALKMQGAL